MNSLLLKLLDLPPQASTYAFDVDLLHYFVISTTMLGATFVFVLALWFLVRNRRRYPGELTARVVTPVPVEFLIIGGILSVFLIFWVVGASEYSHMQHPPEDAMPVYVTAKQWMWKFAYADGRSDIDVLTVPVHRPVKLVMNSRDVIHSFYVPAFRMKQDVVPGRYYTAWFEAQETGEFPIECAEYCGVSHSRMLAKVHVLSEPDYAKWLENPPTGDLAARGRDVAAKRGCLSCHTLDGQPHIGPSWAGLYDSDVKLSDGTIVKADVAYLTRSMMDPQAQIVDSYKPVMPTYRGVIDEPEVAALVELIVSLKDQPIAPSVVLPRTQPLGSAQPQEPR
ncbi:MAG TPA: cytochrome c oxidase subunit II [Polyangiaceae bacterium]